MIPSELKQFSGSLGTFPLPTLETRKTAARPVPIETNRKPELSTMNPVSGSVCPHRSSVSREDETSSTETGSVSEPSFWNQVSKVLGQVGSIYYGVAPEGRGEGCVCVNKRGRQRERRIHIKGPKFDIFTRAFYPQANIQLFLFLFLLLTALHCCCFLTILLFQKILMAFTMANRW